MSNSSTRLLVTTGQVITVLNTIQQHGQSYCHVLIPYTAIERRTARNNKCCHLQIVRENKLGNR
jgi:hypothetical protein